MLQLHSPVMVNVQDNAYMSNTPTIGVPGAGNNRDNFDNEQTEES